VDGTVCLIRAFVDSLSAVKQMQAANAGLQDVLLDLWCDVQASQLRFCVATDLHRNELPFRCRVNPNATLDDVISQFLGMSSSAQIPFTDLGHDDVEENQGHDQEQILDVFVRHLMPSPLGKVHAEAQNRNGNRAI
jgi:hypothetical protein